MSITKRTQASSATILVKRVTSHSFLLLVTRLSSCYLKITVDSTSGCKRHCLNALSVRPVVKLLPTSKVRWHQHQISHPLYFLPSAHNFHSQVQCNVWLFHLIPFCCHSRYVTAIQNYALFLQNHTYCLYQL